MVSWKKILIIGIVVVAVVAVVGIFLWQSMSASFTEAENTVKSYLNTLNNYDLDGSWALMSPHLQLSYASKTDFNSTILEGLKQSGWQASLASTSNSLIQVTNGVTTARFVVVLHISETGVEAYDDIYTFRLIKIGDQWRIDDWLTGEWD